MSKTLVTYFSASGITAGVARKLASVLEADTFEIKPEMPYTDADLDWNDKQSRSSVEMADPNSRPAIKEKVQNMNQYDTVFIGFPIWWYVAPTIINTFLESYSFVGKTIVVFATSGSCGLGNTEQVLKELCTNETKWLPGKLLTSNVSEEELKEWVQKLGLI